jgi:hypothetical protein
MHMKDVETGGVDREDSMFVVGPVDPVEDPAMLPAVVADEESGFLTDLGAALDQPDTAEPDADPDVDPDAPTDVDGQDDHPDEPLPDEAELDDVVSDVDVDDVDDGFDGSDLLGIDLDAIFGDLPVPGRA